MAKKKRNNNAPFWPFFFLVVLPLAAISLSTLAIVRGVEGYVKTSHYFRIKELRVEGLSDQRYLEMLRDEVVGSNIFRVDAGELAVRIQRRFPNFYSVSVSRILPSQLLIVARERLPVALVKSDQAYALDVHGVVVAVNQDMYSSLPVLTGVENNGRILQIGATYPSRQLHNPLLLAKILRMRAPDIRAALPQAPMDVESIDASHPDELSFSLEPDHIEVKVGDRNFDSRISLLPAILRTISGDRTHIKYIDLRPREPVIAAKAEKNKE